MNATAVRLVAPNEMDCKAVKSDTGTGILRTTCQTPARSRSHKVRALRSPSKRNKEGTVLLALGTAAAPISLELLDAPLICSLTSNVHPAKLFELWRDASVFRTTARRKFFCVSSSSGFPSPLISAVL